MNSANKINPIWLVVLGLGIVGGLYTTVRLFSEGHILLSANDNIVWTLPIVSYVFFALVSTGIALFATFPVIFNQQVLIPLEKRLTFLAFATLLSAFVSIGLELGAVGNTIYMLLSPNPASPIWWLSTLYSIEIVLLIVKYNSLSKGQDESKGLTITTAVVGIMAVMVLGLVFGGAESRPTYFGPFMSIYTLVTSLLSGCAAILVYDAVKSICSESQRESLGKTFVILLAITIFISLLRSTLAMAHTSIQAGYSGWLVVFLLAALVASSRKLFAGLVTLVGVFLAHLHLIIGGPVNPVGPKAEGLPATLTYLPNVSEILIFVFSLSLALLLYIWGEKKLRLE
ncbi:MAG: hypothetical protein DRI70_02085 [Bacteroidetes bacterium]|nr:MAG: hypothetical protein DRI70_02085 [Bacteroidota bacterium]